MSYVSLVSIKNNSNFKDDIKKSLYLIDFNFKTNVEKVVIKPNLCYYWDYTTGQTTDPKFIGGLIDLLREEIDPDVDISIVESDASAMRCKHAFKILGYKRLSSEKDVKLINLSEDNVSTETVLVGNKSYELDVPKTIMNSDIRINVPKIKYTVPELKITCALKNIFGCIPKPNKYKYHRDIDNIIVAINKLLNFDLCILDGNVVSGVHPKKIGLIMSSLDPLAFDTVASKIAGVNPYLINYFALSEKENIGSYNYVTKGLNLEDFRKIYPKKGLKNNFFELGLKMIYLLQLQKRLGLE